MENRARLEPSLLFERPWTRGWQETHGCSQVTELQTRARRDLPDIPWPEGEKVFRDGSARAAEGKRVTRHAALKERE